MNASLTPANAKSAHPTLRAVALPILLESMLALLVGVIGTYLASKISDATAAAYGVTNHLWGMMFVLFRVVGAGVGVVVAHRLGAKQFAAADEVARVALGGATWLGGAIGIAAILGADAILALMAAPPIVTETAGPLLRITGFLFLLEAWCVSFAGVLRVHLHVRSVLTAIALMHAIHLALGIALVPRFGIVGYTYAMLASRIVIVVLYLWLWRTRLNIRPRLRDFWQLDLPKLMPLMRIGIPTAIEHLGWVLAFLVSVRVSAQLGAQAMATHTYVLQITSAVILVGVSTGLAVEVLVGRMIGAGHFRHAYHFANRSLALGMLLSGLTALIAAIFGKSLLQIFTQDPKIIALGMTLMWIGVIVEPGRTINIVMNDALRAVGDARFPAVASLPTMAIALAFGAWWLGIHLGLGLVGVWLAYLADEWLRGIVNYGRWFCKGWIPAAQISRRHSRSQH